MIELLSIWNACWVKHATYVSIIYTLNYAANIKYYQVSDDLIQEKYTSYIKRRPAVRYNCKGLIIFVWISFVTINFLKVCQTAGAFFRWCECF